MSQLIVRARLANWFAANTESSGAPRAQLPDQRLALNGFWWNCIRIHPASVVVECLPQPADPLMHLASYDPSHTDLVEQLKAIIHTFRDVAVRQVAGRIVEALVARRIGMSGIRTPRLVHKGKRETVPNEVLSGRRWQLACDDRLIMSDTTETFEELQISFLGGIPVGTIVACAEAEARRFMQDTGLRIKTDHLIEHCCRATGCKVREAQAAIKSLPSEIRRSRGQRDTADRLKGNE
ncbi:MAG TPA: hypothetical protein VMB34_33100 [Acetobacteraceae bacterium]|nr:hypothetical protein [Acetobacteraceae bacterium]